jgi:S-ribosylhomocysteine lyase LuxS involved in autoinducer biosynthesis
MKTITLTNSFHNTEAHVIPQAITTGRNKGYHSISRAAQMRIRKALCGNKGCVCGGTFGERDGYHLAVVGSDYDRNIIVDLRASV